MGVLPDTWISRMARERGMIEPFVDHQVCDSVISYGLSSYGYDFRVGYKFKVFTDFRGALIVDPKDFSPYSNIDVEVAAGGYCVVPPNSFALSQSIEYFRIPRDVLGFCFGKSTYARCGIIINVTPFEPEWEGFLTVEIANATPLPARIYAGEGIGQVTFIKAEEECAISYADRKGKYQGQTGITLPRISGG
jgi:dCTP deaminase